MTRDDSRTAEQLAEAPGSHIGELSPVSLREIWQHEAHDLTPWLADRPELLGGVLGLELELEGTEVSVGSYSADLVFDNAERACRVVVENMYGSTDHDHIGKLITYAAGLDATHAVLLAESFRPEHISALAWLNEVSRSPFSFFGLTLEAWRIDGSRPAPRLRVELQPDDWSRSVRDARSRPPSNNQALCLEFWGQVLSDLHDRHSRWANVQRPAKTPWMVFGTRNAVGYHAAFYGRGSKRRLRAEVFVDASSAVDTATLYERLSSERSNIENALGQELDWEPQVHTKSARISLSIPEYIAESDVNQWPKAQKWLVDALNMMRDVFDPILTRDGG